MQFAMVAIEQAWMIINSVSEHHGGHKLLSGCFCVMSHVDVVSFSCPHGNFIFKSYILKEILIVSVKVRFVTFVKGYSCRSLPSIYLHECFCAKNGCSIVSGRCVMQSSLLKSGRK
jgi:hypothetical protein